MKAKIVSTWNCVRISSSFALPKRAQHDDPELPVQPKHKKHTAEHQHGGADHAADELGHKILHLRDVAGDALNQTGASQLTHNLAGRAGLDPQPLRQLPLGHTRHFPQKHQNTLLTALSFGNAAHGVADVPKIPDQSVICIECIVSSFWKRSSKNA
ncbi:hypothetical protein JQM67_08540 [Anaeromassilibacillus senegalensis]|uniref:Uncharacterized protein n=1 Tax=Anaeromassilibacillus senegalensis TaxID=1673717 RepID=A0ABS9CNC2_9FIRM|nr:hypothetical protein [Anaeromassilibacillus senegalensis]MCF2652648.1 hypothetical protein [Anaeromassilibacillus senegalensis]